MIPAPQTSQSTLHREQQQIALIEHIEFSYYKKLLQLVVSYSLTFSASSTAMLSSARLPLIYALDVHCKNEIAILNKKKFVWGFTNFFC